MRLLSVFSIILSMVVFYPDALFAASDGALGATSSGTSEVSVTIPPRVRVSEIDDLSLGTWNNGGSLSGNDDICIYTNQVGGTYRVTFAGDGSGGAFEVRNGSGSAMAYRVLWNDEQTTAGSVEANSGVSLNGQTGACSSSVSCDDCGNTNANLQVVFEQSTLTGAQSGDYIGEISILVEPE